MLVTLDEGVTSIYVCMFRTNHMALIADAKPDLRLAA